MGAEGVFKSQLIGKKLVTWNPAYTGDHTTSLGVLTDTEIINEQSEWPVVVSGLRGAGGPLSHGQTFNMPPQSAGKTTPNPLEWENVFLSRSLTLKRLEMKNDCFIVPNVLSNMRFVS